jgi:GNAT superfamily N-acetyltransferase
MAQGDPTQSVGLMAQPLIRPAVQPDAPILARLRYQFRASHDPPVEPEAEFVARCTAWMEARLVSGGAWRCWLAQASNRGIGTIWLHWIEKLPNPVGEGERHGYISNLYVEPASRGGGLGSRLLGACLDACLAEDVDAVILWPTPRSRSLYQRHGFTVREDLLERRLRPSSPFS